MKRFIEGVSRTQSTLFPESLEDYIAEDNPVRVIDVFVDGLNLEKQGFSSVQPEATGRPAYHPATLLKLHILRLPQPRPIQPSPRTRDPA
jgi:transposase